MDGRRDVTDDHTVDFIGTLDQANSIIDSLGQLCVTMIGCLVDLDEGNTDVDGERPSLLVFGYGTIRV